MKSKRSSKHNDKSSADVEIPMSSESIEHLKRKKRTRVYLHIPLAQTYLKVLEEMKLSLLTSQNEVQNSSSFIPFVITSAAALECILNDYLILHTGEVCGMQDNTLAKAFLTMSLRGKLDIIVPYFSGNKYAMRQDSVAYQELRRLITLRNDLMHGKSFITGHDVDVEYDEPDRVRLSAITLPKPRYQDISSEQCMKFLNALKDFDHLLSTEQIWTDQNAVPAEYQNLLRKL